MTTQWINGILGLWVLISPFLGFTLSGMMTNLILSGIAIAILGFAGAIYESNWRREHTTMEHRHA